MTVERRPHPAGLRAVAVLVAALAAALTACNRPADPASGEHMGRAPVGSERGPGAMPDDTRSPPSISRAPRSEERPMADAGDKVKDAAITSAVNAKLVADSRLGAMRIDVDTVNGRVALRGSAPDAAARERAQQLASSVEGVVSVDNQLVVGGKG